MISVICVDQTSFFRVCWASSQAYRTYSTGQQRPIMKVHPVCPPTGSTLLNNEQLLDEVFVICGIIKVEVSVISRAEGETDNAYRDLDNFAYRKNRIQ
jgi:hypothetical protein